jgi:hypothetical protein
MTAIERLQELTSGGCEKANRPYMIGFDSTVQAFFVFRPDCKCWNCAWCAAHQRARWTVRTYLGVQAYINSGEQFQLVTLTCHERLKTMSQTLYVWPKAWAKLRHRVNRAAHGWHFLMIPEQHRTGRLHVHLATSASLGKRWWKDNGRECGLGYQAEDMEFRDKEVSPALTAWYVTKYLGKQLDVKAWPRYFHHIRTSQHFPALPAMGENPYDAITWIAMSPKQMLSWLSDKERKNQPIFYTGTGELIS